MTEFAARIGRIRMKAGGADIRLIGHKIDNGNGEDWRGSILANARAIADTATDAEPLAGYFVMGIFKGGSTSTGWRYDPEASAVPRALFPAFAAEIIRRDMITEREARTVFDEMFEWQEGAS